MLQAPLGASLAVATPGFDAIHLLNASAAALWARYNEPGAGADEAALVAHVLENYSVAEAVARDQISALLAEWRRSGLVDAPPRLRPPASQDWIIPPPPSRPLVAGRMALQTPGCAIGLDVEDQALREELARTLASLLDPCVREVSHVLALNGASTQWTLTLNGDACESGDTSDGAIVAVMSLSIDLACRAAERLLVVHGAGLVPPDRAGVLLVAPGGSGKTTLAAALNAQGWALLSDDVVPVDRSGRLLGLGTPICLKPGSWPVLASRRPEIESTALLRRFGETVRLLPPRGATPKAPVAPGLLLFPRYDASSAPCCRPLSPEAALQGVIEAESVIRNLTQEKLDALVRWVGSVPAFALDYPDLDSGLALVLELAG